MLYIFLDLLKYSIILWLNVSFHGLSFLKYKYMYTT